MHYTNKRNILIDFEELELEGGKILVDDIRGMTILLYADETGRRWVDHSPLAGRSTVHIMRSQYNGQNFFQHWRRKRLSNWRSIEERVQFRKKLVSLCPQSLKLSKGNTRCF